MKKLLKLFICLSFLGLAFVSKPESADATIQLYSNKWTWNYNGAAYYYLVGYLADDSWVSGIISQAASNRFKTGYHTNPLYPMTRTTIQTNSPMDFHYDWWGYDVAGVVTYFIKGGTEVSFQESTGPTRNWLYCKIGLSDYEIYEGNMQANEVKRLVLHEMGHVFGLGHSDSTSDVMYEWVMQSSANAVSYNDSAALIQKLGGV